jgi:hypothetical protein
MAPTRKDLYAIDRSAMFSPGEAAKPAAASEIGGRVFSVQYHVVNRKCYDAMPTPTACYKVDGKRVSRKVFYSSAS